MPSPLETVDAPDVFRFRGEAPADAWYNLSEKGEIFKLKRPDHVSSGAGKLSEIYVANTHGLAKEILDDRARFSKDLAGPLTFIHQHLIALTANDLQEHEKEWLSIRDILAKQFAPNALSRWAFEGMNDITQQLALKWERFGPASSLDLTEDFSRLTLDAMGLSGISWRINSFYHSKDEFATAFNGFVDSSVKTAQLEWETWTSNSNEAKSTSEQAGETLALDKEAESSNAKLIVSALETAIKTRVPPAAHKRDFLTGLLEDKKGENGETELKVISRDLALLFIAAIGPTSSLLSSAMYELLKNKSHYEKVQNEVDKVLAAATCTVDQLAGFPEITAVLLETLRLHPPIPAVALRTKEATTIGGKYEIASNSKILINIQSLQRDAWGSDANDFKPERMKDIDVKPWGMTADKKFQPFGDGTDACLTYGFTMMLAKLAIVSLFQRFDFKLADPSYQLKHKQRVALQPAGLSVRALVRGESWPENRSSTGPLNPSGGTATTEQTTSTEAKGQPIYILWGGRDGTCENYAETLARWAPAKGYKPVMAELNRYAGDNKLPKDGPVIIITATYSGFPTANAKDFHSYLKSAKEDETTKYQGVGYGVFGCGRSGWSGTYQKIPIELDDMLAKGGAEKLIDRGEFDAGKPITADAFDDWATKLWEKLQLKYTVTVDESLYREVYEIRKIGNADARHRILRQTETVSAVVVQNRIISTPDDNLPARHLELRMKPGEVRDYEPGDIVSILPTNSFESVRRVFIHFNIALEQDFRATKLSDSVFNFLPAGERVKLFELLVNYVELGKPAQKSHLRVLMKYTNNEDTKSNLQAEIDANLKDTSKNHISILDYLVKYPDIAIPFDRFFVMLPQMRTREYSISSSARWKHDCLTLSYQEHKKGVSSGYLARLSLGDVVRFTHRLSSHASFGLPERPVPESTPQTLAEAALKPVVMFATGTGVAPFRAMIQDRWMQKEQKMAIGKMILFVGCRDPEKDYLYADGDLKEWREQGVLDLRPAFSRTKDPAALADSKNSRYIQDRVRHDKDDIKKWYAEGARFLTCGSVAASNGLIEVGVEVVREVRKERGEEAPISDDEAKDLITKRQIYFTDVFG